MTQGEARERVMTRIRTICHLAAARAGPAGATAPAASYGAWAAAVPRMQTVSGGEPS
jgi:hypothetical protein